MTPPKEEETRMPYVRLLEQNGAVSVWVVDGAYVRKNLDEEFTNFGHHFGCAKIPENEIWLDQETVPDEQHFFLQHARVERELMAQGKDYDTAHEESSKLERHYRNHPADLHEALAGEGWE